MNRINISPLAFVESEPVKTRPQSDTMIEHAIYSTPSDTTEVSQFVPVHYESGYAYPLVVWLESPRENNTYSLLNSMPLVSARNYVGVSLALPNSACDPTIENQLTHPQSIDDAIERAIDQVASRYNIAEHRVFLAGCGSGWIIRLQNRAAKQSLVCRDCFTRRRVSRRTSRSRAMASRPHNSFVLDPGFKIHDLYRNDALRTTSHVV